MLHEGSALAAGTPLAWMPVQAPVAGQQGSPFVLPDFTESCPGRVELSPQPGLRGHALQIPEPCLHSASSLVFCPVGLAATTALSCRLCLLISDGLSSRLSLPGLWPAQRL